MEEEAVRVVAFNGSPHQHGNVAVAIDTVRGELIAQGVEVEVIQVGGKDIVGCRHCNACGRNHNERCVIADDVNETT